MDPELREQVRFAFEIVGVLATIGGAAFGAWRWFLPDARLTCTMVSVPYRRGRTATGGKARYRFSLNAFANKPANYVMSFSEAMAMADRLRTGIRAGTVHPRPEMISRVDPAVTQVTLAHVASRYLDEYARVPTRRAHAIRQFEIYIDLLQSTPVPAADGGLLPLGSKPLVGVTRADLDAVFVARTRAVDAARQAAQEMVDRVRRGEPVPTDLRRAAALAGRSSKGGLVALNRFKARVRHLFNWAVAQGYRDDTPFKRAWRERHTFGKHR